jgi:pilus assembly protein CpaE
MLVVSPSSLDPVAVQLAEQFRRHFGLQAPAAIATYSNYERMVMQDPPPMVAVVLASDPDRGLEVVRQLRRMMSGTILAVGAADSKLILRALHEGAVHYLDAQDLETGVLALASRRREKEETGTVQGRLIALLGSCGGCGASTLAVNLSAVLAKDAGCALIDLKAGRGDLSPLLDLRPTFTLAHLCENATRLDRAMFEKLLVQHTSGIHLLAAPRRFGDSRRVTAAGVAQAVRMARSLFPTVVVDLEDCYHEEQTQTLKQVQDLLLICRLEFTSLRNARRIQDYLVENDIFRGKVHFVINRFGQPGELPVDEAQEALGATLTQFIPDDPRTVNSANNIGVPAVLRYPTSKVVQSIKQFARQLAQADSKSKEIRCAAIR